MFRSVNQASLSYDQISAIRKRVANTSTPEVRKAAIKARDGQQMTKAAFNVKYPSQS